MWLRSRYTACDSLAVRGVSLQASSTETLHCLLAVPCGCLLLSAQALGILSFFSLQPSGTMPFPACLQPPPPPQTMLPLSKPREEEKPVSFWIRFEQLPWLGPFFALSFVGISLEALTRADSPLSVCSTRNSGFEDSTSEHVQSFHH